jgi:hypothetical protein
MNNRQLVLNGVRQLPTDSSLEEILETVRFTVGIKEAMEQADRGEVISLDEAHRRVKAWAKENRETFEAREWLRTTNPKKL